MNHIGIMVCVWCRQMRCAIYGAYLLGSSLCFSLLRRTDPIDSWLLIDWLICDVYARCSPPHRTASLSLSFFFFFVLKTTVACVCVCVCVCVVQTKTPTTPPKNVKTPGLYQKACLGIHLECGDGSDRQFLHWHQRRDRGPHDGRKDHTLLRLSTSGCPPK